MTPEQRAVGEKNYKDAVEALGMNRRQFLKGAAVGAAALGGSAAAVYFGYKMLGGKPVRAALLGAGDEGGVLVGEHNPDFLKFVAVCDVRPSNMRRIYEGDPKASLRKGFKKVYGQGCALEGNLDYIKPYTDYDDFLARLREDPSIEAVVVALPLHLH